MRNLRKSIEKAEPSGHVGQTPILFSNRPSGKPNDDLVGMEAYVEAIHQAIINGNRLIGVLSDFGTGKSTLTEQLRQQYTQKEDFQICTINLWGELAHSNRTSSSNHQTEENLHKSFLYQFAQQVSSACGSYVNQRLNMGYKIMKLSARNGSNIVSLFSAAVLFVFALLFDKNILSIPYLVPKSLYEIIPLLLLLISIVLLAWGLSRSELLFTSPKEQQNRQLHAEDYSEIYTHILRSFHSKSNRFGKKYHKKILLIFEDIDRTPDPRAVYQFLVELHRYYLSDTDPNRSVIFLVNMKPQAILEQELQQQDLTITLDFVKLFDLTISLAPMSTADLSKLLFQYIKINQAFYTFYDVLEQDITLSSLKKVKWFSWLAYGAELDIRHLKHRLNYANQLFYSLHRRFDHDDQKIEIQFDRCAVVAYLEDQYPSDFYKLKPDTIGQILEVVIASDQNDMDNWIEAVSSLTDSGNTSHISPFQKDLADFLYQGLIGQDYRMYFYNYPKHSTVRSFNEDLLFNALIYGRTLDKSQLPLVNSVCHSNSIVVVDALDYIKSLGKPLPWTAVSCEDLFLQVLKHAPDMVEEFLDRHILPHQSDKTIELIKQLISFPIWQTETCHTQRQKLLELLHSRLINNDDATVQAFRLALVKALHQRIIDFRQLFQDPLPPLSSQEANLLSSMKDICKLIIPETVIPDVINILVKRFCETSQPSAADRKALEQLFAATLSEEERGFTQAFYTPLLQRYLLQVQEWVEPLEQYIYQAVEDGEIDYTEYANLVNKMPMKDAPEVIATHITTLSIHSGLSKAACDHLLRYNQGTAYFHNAQKHCLVENWSDEETTLFSACAIDLAQSNAKLFLDLRLRLCQQFAASIQRYTKAFIAPLPQLQTNELALLKLEDGLVLLYENPLTEETVEQIANFLSGQRRTKSQVQTILDYVTQVEDETVRNALFRKLHFVNLPMKAISKHRRQIYWEAVSRDFPMETASHILEYLRHTNYLDKQLEQRFLEAISDNQDHESDFDAYGKFLLLPPNGNYTEITIQIIQQDPYCRVRPEAVLQMLFSKKHYQTYVLSKNLGSSQFIFESDKLSELSSTYINLYKKQDNISEAMMLCQPFLEYLYSLDHWDDLPPQTLLPFASFPQTVPLLDVVLAQDDSFVVSYLESSSGEISFADEASLKHLVRAFVNDTRMTLILNEHARRTLRHSVPKEYKRLLDNAYQRAQRRSLPKT